MLDESKKELLEFFFAKSSGWKDYLTKHPRENFKDYQGWVVDLGNGSKKQVIIYLNDYFGAGNHVSGVFVFELVSDNQFKVIYKQNDCTDTQDTQWFEVRAVNWENKVGFLIILDSNMTSDQNAILMAWDGKRWRPAFEYRFSEINLMIGGLKGSYFDSENGKFYEWVANQTDINGPNCFNFFESKLDWNNEEFSLSPKNRTKMKYSDAEVVVGLIKKNALFDFLKFQSFQPCQ